MSAGLVIATFGGINIGIGGLSYVGFILTMLSTILGELRHIFIQIMLQGRENIGNVNAEKLPPLDMIVYFAPIQVTVLYIYAFVFEYKAFIRSDIYRNHFTRFFQITLLMVGFILAMVYVELTVTQYTSALTGSTLSVLKHMIVVFFSALLLGERVSGLDMIGLLVVLLGLFMYFHTLRRTKDEGNMIFSDQARELRADILCNFSCIHKTKKYYDFVESSFSFRNEKLRVKEDDIFMNNQESIWKQYEYGDENDTGETDNLLPNNFKDGENFLI